MKRKFLDVVPRAVQLWAWVLVGCGLVIGSIVGVWEASGSAGWWMAPAYAAAGLFAGAVLAAWLLGLGFVYADARRRGMRPVLWVLVAMLFPHLLGFLLYFVMRGPVASRCGQCGSSIGAEQRFCSWCGAMQNPGTERGAAMAAGTGLNL